MSNFNVNTQHNPQQDSFAQLEFARMMSMALDGALSSEETARFEQLVYGDLGDLAELEDGFGIEGEEAHEEEAKLARQATWQLWQHLDVSFAETPALAPDPGFAQRFEQRLASQERRQRLWFGAVLAVVAVFVWGLVATAVVSFGPAAGERASTMLDVAAQNAGAFFGSLWLWVEMVGSAFFTVASTAQVMTAVGLYALMAGLAVVAWVSLLRRTTGTLVASTPA